jgi:hypothetical protein
VHGVRIWNRRQVGLAHARETAEVTVEADTYRITVEPGITITTPRAASSEVRRRKASNYHDGEEGSGSDGTCECGLGRKRDPG